MLVNTQYSIIISKRKGWKMSNNRFNRYGGQAGSRISEKNISTVWIVRKFNIGQLGCWTSLVQNFGSLKFLNKQDVGPATWTHINGCIDTFRCTKILRNNLWESMKQWLRIKVIKVLYKTKQHIKIKSTLRRSVLTKTRDGLKLPETI